MEAKLDYVFQSEIKQSGKCVLFQVEKYLKKNPHYMYQFSAWL